MSYRVLYFERNDAQEYRPPDEYPVDALVAASTHDLATLAGFWEAYDLEVRRQLDLFPSEDVRLDVVATRAKELERLRSALDREQLLAADAIEFEAPVMTPQLCDAIHVYLARTPSRVLVVQLEDVFGIKEQANMPGTVEEQPNWRRRLPVTLPQMECDERFIRLAQALSAARP